jgi:hypothetical protein
LFALTGCGSAGSPASTGSTGGADAGGLEAGTPSADAGTGDAGTGDAGTGDASAEIAGKVVDFVSKRPLAGRTVFTSGSSTSVTTDANGAFSVSEAPPLYDAIVVDPDGTTVSVFRGLTRRDPVLPHAATTVSGTTGNVGFATGTISGGTKFPLGTGHVVDISFFSADADGHVRLANSPTGAGGPAYTLGVDWYGPSSTDGQLVALGSFGLGTDDVDGGAADASPGDDGGTFWFVRRTFSMVEGKTETADLALSPIRTAQVSGTIASSSYPVTELLAYYRFPTPHSLVSFDQVNWGASSFNVTVADLTDVGATFCLEAVHGVALGAELATTERCGVAPGSTSASLMLQAPPSLLTPAQGGDVGPDTPFVWTSFDGGIHALQLVSAFPSARAPSITVFTAESTAPWPALSSAGIAFPAGSAYQAIVLGMAPFSTIDDALGPTGFAAVIRTETRTSYSAAMDLSLVAP